MLTKLNNSSLSEFKESLSKRTEWVCYSSANRRYIVTSLTEVLPPAALFPVQGIAQ